MRTELTTASWFFTVEFQYNSDTWDPYAVFIDPYTGKPPADLIAETYDNDGLPTNADVAGKKQVKWHAAKNFITLIPASVMGAPTGT